MPHVADTDNEQVRRIDLTTATATTQSSKIAFAAAPARRVIAARAVIASWRREKQKPGRELLEFRRHREADTPGCLPSRSHRKARTTRATITPHHPGKCLQHCLPCRFPGATGMLSSTKSTDIPTLGVAGNGQPG